MKHYESLIIGHITMDHDTDYLGNETNAIGGAVIYSSASAYALGHKVAALTKINPADSERLTYFTIPNEVTKLSFKPTGNLGLTNLVGIFRAA